MRLSLKIAKGYIYYTTASVSFKSTKQYYILFL